MSMASRRTQTTAAPLTAPSASSVANVCAQFRVAIDLVNETRRADGSAHGGGVHAHHRASAAQVRQHIRRARHAHERRPAIVRQLGALRVARCGILARALSSPPLSAAMALHASQFVWYRRAFVLLSRYSLVNNLRRVS